MSRQTSLSVIVPAYNEQYLIEASLDRLQALAESPLLSRVQVIVVDDASTDETPASLQRFQDSLRHARPGSTFDWLFFRHDRNRGKGAAVRTGLEHANAELTVIHDADLEYYPRDLLKMVPLFLDEDADAVFGSRFLPAEFARALFFRHQLGNKLLTLTCDLVSDLNLSDVETCYKMVRTRLLRSVPLESSDFAIEVELTLKLAKRGARVFEVPISYSGRTYQEGKKINWKDGVRALRALVRFAVSDNIYAEDVRLGGMLARMRRARRLTRWIADSLRPHVGDRVLELGAGIGSLTLNLIPRTTYWATEASSIYVDELRHLCRTRPYLRVAMTDVRRLESFPRSETFDTVICVNVLECLEDDVAALQNMHHVLVEGGRVIVLVPQGPGSYGTLDEMLGRRRRYTAQQLTAAGEKAGFRVREVRGLMRAPMVAWWFNGKILRRRRFGLLELKLADLLVPLFRVADDWVPLPPVSLIAVLEKGEGAPDR